MPECRAVGRGGKMVRLLSCIGAALGLILAAHPAATAQEAPTVDKIKQSGTLVIAHRDIAIPFSYYDDNHRPIGYSIDICLRIADAIKSALGLKKLEITYKEVNASNRIPLVVNGTADMECGSTSNNVARDQQVAFSVTTFIASPRFVTKRKSGLTTLQSLRGKTMAAVAGTATLRQFSQISSKQSIGLVVEPVKDHATAFKMLESGQVDSYGAIDTSAFSMVARSQHFEEYFVSEPLAVDPFGIMFRKNDVTLKKIADQTIEGLFKSGEINRIYEKWFQSSLPRLGFDLHIPMSKALKHAISNPTDSSNPADYDG
jgi:glutamate/aspartate transport system substrate-binding protein